MVTRLIILFFISFSKVYAGACCGASASVPTLITTDHKAKVGLIASNTAFVAKANKDKITNRGNNLQEVSENYTLLGSFLLRDYFQLGITLPYRVNTRRTKNIAESSAGLSDIELSATYEFLPEIFYSKWKPRGFFYFQQSAPISKSVYSSNKFLATDALSSGHYSSGFGLVFLKRWSSFDLNISAELMRPWDRKLNDQVIKRETTQTFSLEGGLSFSSFRLGGSLTNLREGSFRYLTELGINLTYISVNYSLGVAYIDQTVLKDAFNTSLNKSITVTAIRFFEL